MIIRLILLALLLPALANAGQGMGPGPGFKTYSAGGGGSVTCSGTPFITQDQHSDGHNIGSTTSLYYGGIINTSTTALEICSIDIYARENGSLAGKTLYVEKWSVNSSTEALETKVSDVTTVDATLFPSTLEYYNIVVDVSLSQWEALVFTLNETTGETNNLTLARNNVTTVSDQRYRGWTSSLAINNSGEDTDIRAKFYAAQ